VTVAEVDMSPELGVSIGVLLALASAWYWQRLGREDVERSTRAIRRASLVLGLIAVFVLVRSASFVDSEVSPSAYISAWLTALGLVFLVVVLVSVDVFNSIRMHRRFAEQEALKTASGVQSGLRQVVDAASGSSENGK
jgi:hypothetical protein